MFANFHEYRIKISQVLLFFIIFQILNLKIKQRNILSKLRQNFEKTAGISIVSYLLLQLFYFYRIMLHSVCLLYEKKRIATRILIHDCLLLPDLHILKKFYAPAIFTMASSIT